MPAAALGRAMSTKRLSSVLHDNVPGHIRMRQRGVPATAVQKRESMVEVPLVCMHMFFREVLVRL